MARLTANLERVDLEAAEMRAKAATKAEMDADLAEELPTGVSQAVRDLPASWSAPGRTTGLHTIPYDHITAEYNNCDRPGGGCGSIDMATGTFTAMTNGTYFVVFSAQSDLNGDHELELFLNHNGQHLPESRYKTSNSGGRMEVV